MCECSQCNMSPEEMDYLADKAEKEEKRCEKGLPPTAGEKWYFTFGQGHYTPEGYPLKDTVVEIEGSYGDARQLLVEVVGDMFAFQYESAESAGVERFGLNVVSLERLREAFDWE